MWRASVRRWSCYVLGCVAVSGIAAGAAQPTPTLGLLTVPSGSLPSGCALKPADPEPSPVLVTELGNATGTTVVVDSRGRHVVRFPYPFPSNPWFGSDYRFRHMLRRHVDQAGPPRVPDAPPLSRREVAALQSSWADNVAEAYRATYLSGDGGLVEVSAVRFVDAKWAATDWPRVAPGGSRSTSLRIVHGATAILISGPQGSACFDAVSRYVQSLRGLK